MSGLKNDENHHADGGKGSLPTSKYKRGSVDSHRKHSAHGRFRRSDAPRHEERKSLVSQEKKDDVTVDVENFSFLARRSIYADDAVDAWSDSEDENDEEEDRNCLARVILTIRGLISSVLTFAIKATGGYLMKLVFLLAYFAYFIAAMIYRFGDEGSYRLLGCTVLGVIILCRKIIFSACRKLFILVTGSGELSEKGKSRVDCIKFFSRWLMYGAVAGVIAWILIDKALTQPENLRSMPGLVIFMLLCLLFSTKPGKINYHTIFWSLGLQFILSLMVLKWHFGKSAILWVQERLDEFFHNSVAGSKLLFGDTFEDHYMIFGALPLLFFTNGVLSILYYCGAMQFLINVLGNAMTYVLETSNIESTAVASGIFLEGITAVTALRPYLFTLSKSQLFLVTTSCFASLGGAFLAVLSKVGISVELIIGAMLVSAPATFTVCKLMVPESRPVGKTSVSGLVDLIGNEEKRKYANILDALQTGAMNMLPVFANVVVSAFALVCFIAWINETLTWFGDRVGVEGVTIEWICSYLLFPVSLAMGVELPDCRRVAMLYGIRLGSSNLIAFFKLTEMRYNRAVFYDYMMKTNGTGGVELVHDDIFLVNWNKTLNLGFISERSEAIITYGLCGFSSFLSVAIHLGMLAIFVPQRRPWLIRMAVPALVAGNVANCITGCFACLFY